MGLLRFFFARGVAYVAKAEGLPPAAKGKLGSWRVPEGATDQVELVLCGQRFRLTFADPSAP